MIVPRSTIATLVLDSWAFIIPETFVLAVMSRGHDVGEMAADRTGHRAPNGGHL